MAENELGARRINLSTSRGNPLVVDFITMYRGKVMTEADVLQQTRLFLSQNPQVLADLDQQHKTNTDPFGVTMAIVPKLGLVLGRYRDNLYALVPTISCTVGAIRMLFNSNLDRQGYGVFTSSSRYEEFQRHILRAVQANDVYVNFLGATTQPEDYVAAAIQDFIIEGTGGNDRVELTR